MSDLLDNPVYNALVTSDASLSFGTENVKFFHEEVSPFVGFDHSYKNGFDDLFHLLPAGRVVLYATPTPVDVPRGWKLIVHAPGLQFVLTSMKSLVKNSVDIVQLHEQQVNEMMELTILIKGGLLKVQPQFYKHPVSSRTTCSELK